MRTRTRDGWTGNPASEAAIQGAAEIVEGVVRMEVDPELKAVVVNTMIWQITVVNGKYDTRFFSERALESPDDLRHDHVYTRHSLIKRILEAREPVDSVLKDAIACVVTKAEHEDKLNRVGATINGWARYRTAAIPVVDRSTGRLLEI